MIHVCFTKEAVYDYEYIITNTLSDSVVQSKWCTGPEQHCRNTTSYKYVILDATGAPVMLLPALLKEDPFSVYCIAITSATSSHTKILGQL